ncbi:hypothetical protein Sru01_42130 [Sphaerisporangium rufum]|uniref:RAMA domain-containing protein n=1 Tax=Sphaerisporangium rufum TaxID=1381558 RepID=A0A919R6D1_9ACTN|nr:hypothetical protein Sru01_42130 [Sphaerisporangium rufum]
MRTIEIDEEVYSFLQAQAKAWIEEPNDVLRRLLLTEPTHRDEGALLPLIKAGLLQPAERLMWKRPRLGRVHYATVLPDGRLQLANGEAFTKPSPACKALSKQETDGWSAWHRLPDNTSLKDLRAEARRRGVAI